MKEFIFTLGLPGSGKTTYLEKYYDRNDNIYISTDEIKLECNVNHLHAVKIAEDAIYENLDAANIIFDGGGISQNYIFRILEKVREKEYKITCLYFNTPIEVCISRIKSRNTEHNNVPLENMYYKNMILPGVITRLSNCVDEFITIQYFNSPRLIIFDMDGTLCEIQDFPRDIHGNLDFVNNAFLFSASKPIGPMLKILKSIDTRNTDIMILSACANSYVAYAKKNWIESNINESNVNDAVCFEWVGNKDYKDVFLEQYIIGCKIDPRDVLYIDDNMEMLSKMKKIGINAKHVSQIIAEYHE